MKVLCLAIFFAFFFRSSNDDREAKEYLDENEIKLNRDEVADARHRRLKDVQMWSIIRETLTYFSFLIFLCVIVYSIRDENTFLQVQHLRNYFSNEKYSQITRIDEYWTWLEKDFINDLRAKKWYNQEESRYLSGFINDKTNRLIGWTIMRQL
jgi:hypothetical protein